MDNNLLILRKDNNLTQKEVALNVGITTSAYGMLETGYRTPSLITAYKLSRFFGTSIEDIFFDKNTTKC